MSDRLLASLGNEELASHHRLIPHTRWFVIGACLTSSPSQSVVLTAMSFWVANTSLLWAGGISLGLTVLAIAQMGVHLVFFLHVTTGPHNTNCERATLRRACSKNTFCCPKGQVRYLDGKIYRYDCGNPLVPT